MSKEQQLEMQITGGFTVIIDAIDLPIVEPYSWCGLVKSNTVYAVTHIKGKFTRMHRLLMNAPKGVLIDHINGNGLDNRRNNLRFATVSDNMRNTKLKSAKYTKYKGVFPSISGKRYHARIWNGVKNLFLGSYETPEDAALAYNFKAIELFGEFAYLNKIQSNG